MEAMLVRAAKIIRWAYANRYVFRDSTLCITTKLDMGFCIC